MNYWIQLDDDGGLVMMDVDLIKYEVDVILMYKKKSLIGIFPYGQFKYIIPIFNEKDSFKDAYI